MHQILRQTKDLYHAYYDTYGRPYTSPIKVMGTTVERKDVDSFFRGYLDLVLKTKIISESTKIFIKSTSRSVQSVIDAHNRSLEEQHLHISYATMQAMCLYDTKKLQRFFTDDMISKCLFKKVDITPYLKAFSVAEAEYIKKSKALSAIALKIPRAHPEAELSDNDYREIISIIAPYTRSHMQYISENLPLKSVGYIHHLLHSSDLSDLDQERKRALLDLLS